VGNKPKLTHALGRDLQSEMIEQNTAADRSPENRVEKGIREVPLLDALHFLQEGLRVSEAQAGAPLGDRVAVLAPDQVVLRPGVPPEDRLFFISNWDLK
jgi:hypothetical protein